MDRQLLARATEGTDAPTPGYMYVDLAKAATSNPNACQEMAAYLVNRLQSKNNPNIKWKCCKVIAKLADQVPRNAFRRCLSSNPNNTAALKEAMNFRGQPDPVNGDAANVRVRTAAKEALDAVYTESSSSQNHAAAAGGMQGVGSHSYGAAPHAGGGGYNGGGGGGGGARRMEGIGSDRSYRPGQYQGQQPNAHIKSVVQEAGSVIAAMVKDPLARNANVTVAPARGHSGNLPGYGGAQYGRPPPGASELSRQTGGQWTMASNRGPGAVAPAGSGGGPPPPPPANHQQEEYYKQRDPSFQWAQKGGSPAGSGVGGSWANAAAPPGGVASQARQPAYNHGTPSVTINHGGPPGSGGTHGGGGTAVSDGTYEKNLILELCPAGGMKAVPPPDKLANFKRSAPSLNPDLICPVLLDCLEEGQPWIIRAKALCVMEACIESGGRMDGSNAYRDFFFACQEEVAPMASHPRSAIKEPARRVLILLGVDASTAAAHKAPGSAAPAAPPPNLLDFDEAPAPPTSQPPPPPSAAPPPPPADAASGGGASMFGGMQVKSKSPNTPGAPAAPAPVAAAPTSGNLLDFMGAAPATPAPAAAASNSENASTEPAAASSMFAEMNLKGEDQQSGSQDAGDLASVAANGSAFGFINQTSPTPETPDAAGVPPPPAPLQQQTSQSFDPLLNMTPNTAQRKTMQMSPEQMQAMAYQQMRMQQQQMQMQMAYMQQQVAANGGRPVAGAGGPMPPMFPAMGANVMGSHSGGAASSGFSFMDAKPAKKDDKKFDFVKDAMQSANKK